MQFDISEQLNTPGSNKLLKWLILLVLVLLIVSVVSLWFTKPSFSEKDVVFQLAGPMQAMSGGEVTYKLKWANNTKLDLKNLSFRFSYPEDSVVIKDGLAAGETNIGFSLDKLASGESGEREFKAFLVGDKGNIKDAKASLIFYANGLSSSFEKSSTASTTIVSLPVPLTLVAPPSVVSGQPVTYILDYRNESNADISDLRLEFAFPDGFKPVKTTPNPTTGGNVWDIPLLKQNGGSRITIDGTLSGNERESKELSVALKRKVNGQFVDYEKAKTTTIISSPLLGLVISVNDIKDYAAHLGDTLQYTVRYRNSSNKSLQGLTLTVKLEGDMYDFTSVVPGSSFFDSGANTLTWNSGGVRDFSTFAPGTSGQVNFSVKLKQGFVSGVAGSRNLLVKSTATLSTFNVPTGIDGQEVSTSTSLVTKITTQPALTQLIYYSDPVTGSSGPLPPQVGKETLFTVHWQLVNPGNDTSAAKITAILPPGVAWKNVVSTGTGQPLPVFNKNSSEVSWNIGTLPQSVGVSTPKYEATFQMGLTPSATQQGAAAELLNNTTFTGTDSFTRQSIVVHVRDATSDDLFDRPQSGKVQ